MRHDTEGSVKPVVQEFKDFISKGNVVEIAVGLVMALYFQKIVDAVLNGVINPIIAAIFGEGSFTEIGFDIGDARISIGLVIDALISFIAVAFFLFLVIKAYNKFKRSDPAAEPSDNQLLTEIRDELRAGRQSS
jgi:large conductance mechanosensitive channel